MESTSSPFFCSPYMFDLGVPSVSCQEPHTGTRASAAPCIEQSSNRLDALLTNAMCTILSQTGRCQVVNKRRHPFSGADSPLSSGILRIFNSPTPVKRAEGVYEQQQLMAQQQEQQQQEAVSDQVRELWGGGGDDL